MPRRSRSRELDRRFVAYGRSDRETADYGRTGYGPTDYDYAPTGYGPTDYDYAPTGYGPTDYGYPPADYGPADYGPAGYGPADYGPADGEPTGKPPGKRRRAKRIALIGGLVLTLLAGGGAIGAGLYVRSVESDIARVDAFDDVPEESRPQKVSGAMNILLLGSDSRDPEVAGSRTDSIIMAHVPADRSAAQLISIPRDTWVRVPPAKEGGQGNRDAKINAAFSWGGPSLMVQTVESFTGVRIDHVVLIDFAGFKEIVDALGGVDIVVDRNFTSIHRPFRNFTKGKRHMDGETALDYARQRKQFPDGDFTRIRHQQQLIKAVLDRAASTGLLANPTRLNSFVRATANAVTVDRTLSVLDMAMDLRHLRGNNLTFITSPTRGTGRVGTESVVFADTAKAKVFYDAVRRDAVAELTAAAR